MDVRTVKASGLWRGEERQASQVPGEPLQQESQRAMLEGICPIGAEQSRFPGGQEGGEEMKNSHRQEVLGNTKEVNRVEAKRKERPSVLHHATHWAKSRFPRVTKRAWAVHERVGVRIAPRQGYSITNGKVSPPKWHRTRRDGTPWAKHHHCRLGRPRCQTRSAIADPILQQRPKRPADQTRTPQTTQDHRQTTDLEHVRTRNRGNLSHRRDEAVDKAVLRVTNHNELVAACHARNCT